ncbi:MAG: helix-turn-helix domain-containing protein [Bacteroidales bacterium]|nr:helix-turn-helix domain-containing protein [Bacteroidales bacterium]
MYRLILLVLFPICLSAKINPDSLKIQLQSSKGKEKLQILQTLTRHYLFESTDSCLKYGNETIELAQKLNDKENEAQANKKIGYALFRTAEYNKCLPYFEQARQLFIETQHYLDATVISNFFGDTYNQLGNFNKAMEYFVQAEKSCDTLIYNDTIKKSVKQLYSILYTNMGLLYHKLDSINKPLRYFEDALKFAEELKDSTRITASYSNIGMIYNSQDNFEKALKKYFEGLRISQKIGHDHYESAILNNIANIYKNREMSDSAMIYFVKAKNIIIRIGDKYGLSLVNRNIADIYIKLEKYDSALKLAQIALAIAEEIGAKDQIYLSYELLSEIYKVKGNNNQAYNYYRKFAELKDSVSGSETREKIADIRTKYETEKKEKENLGLKKDNEIKELQLSSKNITITFLIAGILVIASALIVIFLQLYQKRVAFNNLVRKNLEIAVAERKLDENREIIEKLKGREAEIKEKGLDPEEDLIQKLNNYLKKEKPFLLRNITIEDIVKELETNRTYLSKAIRDKLNHNFNSLINDLRIKEARQMLADLRYKHISIEGIGQMVGFNSKSSFHTKFKENTGVTPFYFRENTK